MSIRNIVLDARDVGIEVKFGEFPALSVVPHYPVSVGGQDTCDAVASYHVETTSINKTCHETASAEPALCGSSPSILQIGDKALKCYDSAVELQ